MANLTAAYEAYERPGIVVAYKNAVAKAFKGSLVGVTAAGYLTPMTPNTAGLKFVGVANETVDNSTGNAGDKTTTVTKTGSFLFKAGGFVPAIADLGKEVYATTDWEVQITSVGLTNPYKVGTIVALETTSTGATGVRVRIDNYTV